MENDNPANALELGTAIVRASWEAALRSNAQASAVLEQVSKLQAETLARLTAETLRAQGDFAELGNRVFAANARALAESFGKVAAAIEEAGERKAAASAQTAEAAVRRRDEKAA